MKIIISLIPHSLIGYKNAQNLAAIKEGEQRRQKSFELASQLPLQQTYESNPLAQKNEHLFQTASKQSQKRRRKRKDKENFSNPM